MNHGGGARDDTNIEVLDILNGWRLDRRLRLEYLHELLGVLSERIRSDA
jgi:hypothetical protein